MTVQELFFSKNAFDSLLSIGENKLGSDWEYRELSEHTQYVENLHLVGDFDVINSLVMEKAELWRLYEVSHHVWLKTKNYHMNFMKRCTEKFTV